MLRRPYLFLIPSVLVGGALFGACTINSQSEETNTGHGGSGGSTSTTTSDGGSTSTGTGGDTSTGGSGGANTGGSGGGTSCVGDTGTGQTDAACDAMNIAAVPDTCTDTGGTDGTLPPPGLATCHQGFAVYTPGSSENLLQCLQALPATPADACDPAQVESCLQKVHTEACDTADAQSYCNDIATACTAGGDTLDESACNYYLRPFTSASQDAIVQCFNDSTDVCDTAIANCANAQLFP